MISRAGRSPWRRLLVAVLSVVVLFAGGNPFTDNGGHAFAREPVEALQTGATAGGWGNRVGFVDTHRLDEHFEKHGAEFGNITKQDYLHQAQLLRDAAPGGPGAAGRANRRCDDALRPPDRRLHRLQPQRHHPHLLQAERRRTLFSPPGRTVRGMSATPPPSAPNVQEIRDQIDQWSTFVTDLARQDYTFDLDNWRNDVDLRQLIVEALPMFSREELGEHALKLDDADTTFRAATRDFKKCVWGHGTARKENWTGQKNWWYFRAPLRSNGQLDDELATVR